MPHGDPAAMMKKGHIDFELKGDKLQGRLAPGQAAPALRRKARQLAAHQVRRRICRPQARHPRGRAAIGEVGPDRRRGRQGSGCPRVAIEPQGEERRCRPRRRRPRRQRQRARARPVPGETKLPPFIPPCLARLEKNPPPGDEWLHEVKFDGYRIEAHVAGGEVKLYTRTGLDWTHRFGEPRRRRRWPASTCKSAVIDGEIVVLGKDGVSTFSELQLALSEGKGERMIFYAFDLLWLDGEDIRAEPLIDRKEKLRDLMQGARRAGAVALQRAFLRARQGDAGACLPHGPRRRRLQACRRALSQRPRPRLGEVEMHASPGIRDRRLSAVGQAAGRGIRSLVLGYHKDGKLQPVGHVGTGFSGRVMADLTQEARRAEDEIIALSPAPPQGRRASSG